MTTRLDDAEIALNNAESALKEKEDSSDVKAAKQRLDTYRVREPVDLRISLKCFVRSN